MTGTPGKRLALALAASLTAATLAACGSSDGDSGTSNDSSEGTSTSTNSGPAPTGSTIKIGMATSLSGGSASVGEDAKPAAEAWAQWVNGNGGIAGHKVEVLVEDSKSQAAAGLAVAKDLVENQGVAAMLLFDSTAEAASIDYLQEQKMPILGSGYNQEIYGALPYVYQPQTSIVAQLKGLPIAAESEGFSTYGAVVCQEVPACAQAAPLIEGAVTDAGLEWAGLVTAAGSQPNYTAQCLQLIQEGADFIYVGLPPAVGVRFMSDCKQQGFTGSFGSSAGSGRVADLEDVPAGTEILVTLSAFPWFVDSPAVNDYRAAMEEYASDVNYRSGSSVSAWSSLELLRKALASTPEDAEVTPQMVNDAMGTIQDDSLDGLLASKMTLSPTEVTPPVNCMWFVKYVFGDEDFSLIEGTGDSGNGADGDLASTCVE